MAMLLFARRWREESRTLLSWMITIGLVTFGVLVFAMVFVNLGETTRSFNEFITKAPPAVREIFGSEMVTNMGGYVTGIVFNTILPGLVLVFACLSAAGIYTREAGQGNLEFLFSLPVARWHLATGRMLVFLTNLALVHLAIYIGAIGGMLAYGAPVDAVRLALSMCNQYLLYAAVGGLVFWISLAFTDYNKLLLIVMAIFFGLFVMKISVAPEQELPALLRSLGRAIAGREKLPQGALSVLNPFYYYDAAQILARGLARWWNYLVLAGATLVFWAGGIRTYVRKQV